MAGTKPLGDVIDAISASHHEYWNSFYAGRRSAEVPADPSAFAEWVRPQLAPSSTVVELGFGNARDSLWFARSGLSVHGLDFAESAVRHAQERASREELPARFGMLDLYDTGAVDLVSKQVRADVSGPRSLYARFLIHSLEEDGRANLFRFAGAVLADGGEIYLEFRTGEDREGPHLFGDDHYRVYLDPAVVVAGLEEHGATVVQHVTGHGLAVYKTEDPHVARVVAQWT